jgi:hypothetical protein
VLRKAARKEAGSGFSHKASAKRQAAPGGVAVVVEVEVALRGTGKAGEGEDGADGQGV